MKKIISLLIVCLLIPTGCCSALAQTEKAQILPQLETSFGISIDTNLSLFVINEQFVLEPLFDEKNGLVKISVLPKYYLSEQHPEWKEPHDRPHLSRADYEFVFSRLIAIKTLGKLIGRFFNPFITNSTSYRTEYYENAELTYLESFYFDKDTDKERVRSIYISYRHPVVGKITGKRSDRRSKYRPFLGCIGNKCYFVNEDTYKRLKIGSRVDFEGIAAPEYVNLETFGRKIKPS